MHFCEEWVWENAYSSLKGVATPINLCIILFNNHSQFFVILSIFSEMYWTNMFKKLIKIFSAKNCILPYNACIHFYLSILLFAT